CKPANFADHRVASNAAKLGGDVTGGEAVGPQLLQHLHAFICPAHFLKPLILRKVRQNPPSGLGNACWPDAYSHPRFTRENSRSAARDVVLNDRKTTTWRDWGARVGAPRVHMFRVRWHTHPHLSHVCRPSVDRHSGCLGSD